jgi:hypothetical protein
MPFHRAVLLTAIIVAAGVIAGALLFFNGPTQAYRNCVALMWDRKHPAEVKRRQEEARLRECETERLRKGWDCDCSVVEGPRQCFLFPPPIPWGDPLAAGDIGRPSFPQENPCDDLSLEDLRRADTDSGPDMADECITAKSIDDIIPFGPPEAYEACKKKWHGAHD